jgi:hypothetical protein
MKISRLGSPHGLSDCISYIFERLAPDIRSLPFDLPTEQELVASGFYRVSGPVAAHAVAVMRDEYTVIDEFINTEKRLVAVHMAIIREDDCYRVDHRLGTNGRVKKNRSLDYAVRGYVPDRKASALLFLRRS